MDDQTKELLNDLIQSIIDGNSNALDEIYLIMRKVMFSIAYIILWNIQDAEDAVHDTFIMIVKKAKMFTYKNNAYAWINSITKNVAKNKLKKRKNRNEHPLNDDIKPNRLIEDNGLVVKEIFGLLNNYEKDLIIFKYWYGLSFSEIGKIVHKPKPTIVSQLNKIESNIKKYYNIS